MRHHLLLLLLVLCTRSAAQAPQAFDFQGVARDVSGNVLSLRGVSVRLSIHSGSANGPIAYQETHATTTNPFGLFSVSVGSGSTVQGAFTEIPWGGAAHFLQVEFDVQGGNAYVDMGTTQLLSVPYALHAGSVPCSTVSLLGDTLKQSNGCFVIIPGLSAANGGCRDADQDGYYDKTGCNTPVDCDDNNSSVHPGAEDLCGNGVDEDCSGTADDQADADQWPTWYPDADGDGYGDNSISITACAAPEGYITTGHDCDDNDPNVFLGQGCSLTCTAEDKEWLDANFPFYMEAFMTALSNCFGTGSPTTCIQNALEEQGVPVSAECNSCSILWVICLQQQCLADCTDGNEACLECALSSGCTADLLQCMGLVDADNDGVPAGSDCDDNDASVGSPAVETCNGIDDDCDGAVDENGVCDCPDNDADGFTTCAGDCDDSNLAVGPGAVEICNGIDDDCDGIVDESCPLGQACDGDDADLCPDGIVVCGFDGGCLCDESTPAHVEVCNGEDDDCDGEVDEDNVCP
ncbi:MAG TPA: putative metal-binding motif-containing protein [Flavobacteriales bacterium]